MNSFTIKDLENLSGIKAHTIRIWEQRYSFLKPKRSQTNIRFYENDELKTLLNIALLNKYGFKISHIDKMTQDTIKEKILSLNSAEAQQERLINSLLHCMIELDAESFEEIVDNHIHSYGIDKTINHLIFPFLDKIGILWVTDHIRIAEEHLVSSIIRQKIIMGIQNVSNLELGSKQVVMFLPEGEMHELGLLYVHYLTKIKGTKVTYLGANLPIDDLKYVASVKKPDYLYSHLTSLPGKFNLEKYLAAVSMKITETPIALSGRIFQNFAGKIPRNVTVCRTLPDVIRLLTG